MWLENELVLHRGRRGLEESGRSPVEDPALRWPQVTALGPGRAPLHLRPPHALGQGWTCTDSCGFQSFFSRSHMQVSWWRVDVSSC